MVATFCNTFTMVHDLAALAALRAPTPSSLVVFSSPPSTRGALISISSFTTFFYSLDISIYVNVKQTIFSIQTQCSYGTYHQTQIQSLIQFENRLNTSSDTTKMRHSSSNPGDRRKCKVSHSIVRATQTINIHFIRANLKENMT